jgi:hypothetical protein
VNRRAQPSVADRAVYDGRDRLGSIEQHDGEYVARARSGKVLGRFDAAHESIAAVLKAATRAP